MLSRPKGRRLSALALACALGVLLGVPAQAAVAAPVGGINITGLDYGSVPAEADASIATAKALHARLVRADLPWAVLQPSGPGALSPSALAFTDRLFSDAAAAGIGVIATVGGTPCWASSAPAALLSACRKARLTAANAWPPVDPSTYGGVLGALAQRYGTHLAALEVWNEPDQANELYFAGPNKAQRYAAVLAAGYAAVKAVSPAVPVLGGSLVGSNGAFLRALYAAGIQGHYDGLAVHYYNLSLASVRSIHEVQLRYGDHTPLWLDEFGWASCWPTRAQEEQPCVTQKVQALNIVNLYRSLAHTAYVAADVMFQLRDRRGEQFGVLTTSGAHKPSFAALKRVLTSPAGPVSRVTLSLRARRGHTVASGTAPVGDFMELEASVHGVLRYRAIFVLDRFNRYSITLPAVLGTSAIQVRTFQYGAPKRFARRSL